MTAKRREKKPSSETPTRTVSVKSDDKPTRLIPATVPAAASAFAIFAFFYDKMWG